MTDMTDTAKTIDSKTLLELLQEQSTKPKIEDYSQIMLRYGIYKGETLGNMLSSGDKERVSYLVWLRDNIKSEFMRKAVSFEINKKINELKKQ